MLRILFVIIFVFIILSGLGLAQHRNTVQSFIGPSILLNKNSTGVSVGVSYAKLYEKGELQISLSHLRSTSDNEISEYDEVSKLFYRDFKRPNPNDNPFLWNEEDFPGMNLKSRPSRFFALDFSISYRFLSKMNKKGFIYYGAGGGFSWRDDIEVVKVIHVREMQVFFNRYYDKYVPVIRYHNYLDFSSLIALGIKHNLIDQLYVDLGLDFRYFPFSNDWWFRSVFSLGFYF